MRNIQALYSSVGILGFTSDVHSKNKWCTLQGEVSIDNDIRNKIYALSNLSRTQDISWKKIFKRRKSELKECLVWQLLRSILKIFLFPSFPYQTYSLLCHTFHFPYLPSLSLAFTLWEHRVMWLILFVKEESCQKRENFQFWNYTLQLFPIFRVPRLISALGKLGCVQGVEGESFKFELSTLRVKVTLALWSSTSISLMFSIQ